jgi:hypothetical protein
VDAVHDEAQAAGLIPGDCLNDNGSIGPDQYNHAILAILLASAIAASTESVVRRLWNNAKDCLWLCDIAAVRRQSGVTAVRAFKCIVEFVHHGLAIHAV